MQYLNKEIESLVKKKESNTLVNKQYSCGIFQDIYQESLGTSKSQK